MGGSNRGGGRKHGGGGAQPGQRGAGGPAAAKPATKPAGRGGRSGRGGRGRSDGGRGRSGSRGRGDGGGGAHEALSVTTTTLRFAIQACDTDYAPSDITPLRSLMTSLLSRLAPTGDAAAASTPAAPVAARADVSAEDVERKVRRTLQPQLCALWRAA
jgi:hypothetical protein